MDFGFEFDSGFGLLHCPLSAAVGHLKEQKEARLTFAAQAALLAKSQIAAWQMENAEAKWRIVGYLMNYSLAGAATKGGGECLLY